MAKTVTCRLFPEKAEFRSLEEGGKLVRERKYRVEIPEIDFKRLEEDADEERVDPEEIIERRFFSVADLPESWAAQPVDEKRSE